MENCQKSRLEQRTDFVVINIRGASVMFVRGMCISTLDLFKISVMFRQYR